VKVEEIAAVIERKRQHHPELARGLTWPGMTRICQREGVRLCTSPEPLPRPAQLVPFRGRWGILLSKDAPFRRHTYLAAHELGHLWLHHDQQHDRAERVYNMDTWWVDDPREDDAELFASLVLMGPTRARPHIPLVQGEHETALHFALRTMRRTPRGYR
jgi:IrrE N-terminal-like domain